MRIKTEDFLVYFLIAPSLVLYHALERFKFIYFIPVIFWLIVLFNAFYNKNEKIRIDRNTGIGLLLYLLIAITSIISGFWKIEPSTAIRDVIIFSSPLVVFLYRSSFKMIHAKVLFVAAILSYIAWVGLGSFSLDISFNILRSNYNSNAEFHNGIIFGGFFLLFLDKKKWLWAFLVLVVIVLSGKRAIYLGLLPAFGAFYVFLVPTGIIEKKDLLGISLAIYFLIFLIVGYFLIDMSQWFIDQFDTTGRLSVSSFLMGREKFVIGLGNEFSSSGLVAKLFGHGPGQADYFLFSEIKPDWVHKGKPVNPHNDSLKLIFDYGWVGAVSFFLVMYSFYVKNRAGVLMIMYTIPLFLVDNSLIFIYYLFIGGVIARIES